MNDDETRVLSIILGAQEALCSYLCKAIPQARNIPVSNSVGCYRAMVSEPAWMMWVRVGIMPLLSVSLVA